MEPPSRPRLAKVRFDSGALGMLDAIVHRLDLGGGFSMVVYRNGLELGRYRLEVLENLGGESLELDLSQPQLLHCQVRVGTSLRFWASQGSGYSVRLLKGLETVFDSEALDSRDLYMLRLPRPARYSMVNRLSGARGHLSVVSEARAIEQTVFVEVERTRFVPSSKQVTLNQPLVFRVGERSRIVVEHYGGDPTANS